MYLFGAGPVGLTLLVLWLLQGLVIGAAPKPARPSGPLEGGTAKFFNVLNLLMLVVIYPIVGAMLVVGYDRPIVETALFTSSATISTILNALGIIFLFAGNTFMVWGRISLGRNFRLAGTAPGSGDGLVIRGPYSFVRHPMYSAAATIALGVALVLQSGPLLGLFVVLTVTIFVLIPGEEKLLESVYGDAFAAYKREVTAAFIPYVF